MGIMARKKVETPKNAKTLPLAKFDVEWWPIERVIPYERNARIIPQKAVDKVAASLREFGWRQPIVVDPKGIIVVGHARRMGALKNGWPKVPVHVANDLTAAQIKAYRLADNRTAMESMFDDEILRLEFADLKALDIDLTMTGFELPKINGILDGIAGAPKWSGMPEFNQDDQTPFQSLHCHFANAEDRDKFAALIGQKVTDDTRTIWYPPAPIGRYANKRFRTSSEVNPTYPVYIISKGRWETRLTSKALEAISVPYRIVVEPQEFDSYASVIDPAKILTLPFSNLGQGSIPARNWVWEHSISEGATRHWILDDNIKAFFRLNDNLKTPVGTGAVFAACEEFVDRYTNVAIAGMNYFMFASRKSLVPPITPNTRIYSCILIDNSISHRWRGRYNEDTDLSLRALKDGYCTVLFNAFLCKKAVTMTMKGGNTDELYKDDGRLKMAESLREQHPDVTKVTRKWGRWQHHVDYSPFKKNRFIPKPGFVEPTEANNYGMELEILDQVTVNAES